MAHPRRPDVRAADLRGLKYFPLVDSLLERLHDIGTARDKAHNRKLFFDQYVSLLLLYFFSPIVTSLRGLQQAAGLDKVQELLGTDPPSFGALSEAGSVFDPAPLRDIVQELAQRAVPLETGAAAQALRDLTAVDGSILPALPRMVWALWQDPEHRAAKLHLHFDVLKGVPCDATITAANGPEADELIATLAPGRLYVLDRGYACFRLLEAILDLGSSFVVRVKDSTTYGLAKERPLTDAARAAGVVRDLEVCRLGVLYGQDTIHRKLRLVIVRRPKPDGGTEELWLVTDRLDLDAELVALAYRYRWTVELFFRWFKCILDCRHLLAQSANGVTIQCYVALIASLLVTLWTGRKPTKRTWEMIQFYLLGWASLAELQALLERLRAQDEARAKKKATR